MSPRLQSQLIRWVIHLLLAVFLANAANKFFVIDLDYEFDHQVYAQIFQGNGPAPDQYRILPLLPLKLLCDHLPFNHAVLVYNAVFGFLVFELFWWIMGGIQPRTKYAFNIVFAGAYIYAQYTGWRPETLGLVFLAALAVSPFLVPMGIAKHLEDPVSRQKPSLVSLIAWTLLLIALTLSRADIAVVYLIYLGLYQARSIWLTVLWFLIPVAGQYLLQEVIYPDATYYTDRIMLMDNLRGYYLLRHPATYLLLALALMYGKSIRNFIRSTWRYKWFYGACLGYLALVLVVGRLNEYRLYLPILPIFLVIWREQHQAHGPATDPI